MEVNLYNTNKKYNVIYADPPWSYQQWCNYSSLIYDAVLVRRKRKRKKYRIDSRNGHIEKMRRNHCRRKIRNFGGNVKGD